MSHKGHAFCVEEGDVPSKPAPLCHCGTRAQPGTNRCPTHEAQHQANRNTTRTHYGGDWPAISRAARAHHLATVGPWCTGYQRDGHWVQPSDLTADHVNPRSLDQGVAIMCRACNGRKGGRSPDR